MGYHTVAYLVFFLPAVLLAYQLTPRSKRWLVLLAAGYSFFRLISGKLVLFLMGITIFTHYIGTWLQWKKQQCRDALREYAEQKAANQKCTNQKSTDQKTVGNLHTDKDRTAISQQYKKEQKHILAFGIIILLAVLVGMKYSGFFVDNVNHILLSAGSTKQFELTKMLLPIGISFYTLQAVGYMADVYWDRIKEEQPLGKVALFLGFFPQIMEGPIAMYGQTAEELWKSGDLRAENLCHGAVRILWGLFKKMIIADRLYLLVQGVFEYHEAYTGAVVIVAAIGYATQLYIEFSGCLDIVIGSGKLFGVTLPENFRQPFCATSAAEFWKRWHISLGVWFKTYIFYPVSVSGLVKKWNRFGKKHTSKYITRLGVSAICLFPVWMCNGFWHGPRWSYIFYGVYYFVILMLEQAVEPWKKKQLAAFRIREEAAGWKLLMIAKTWCIIFTGELFFRANGLRAGMQMFASIFQGFSVEKLWDGTMLAFGLDKADYFAILCGILVVGIVGFLKERKLLDFEHMQRMRMPVRWAVYYGLILAVLIFGAYGIGYQQVDLIYAGF